MKQAPYDLHQRMMIDQTELYQELIHNVGKDVRLERAHGFVYFGKIVSCTPKELIIQQHSKGCLQTIPLKEIETYKIKGRNK